MRCCQTLRAQASRVRKEEKNKRATDHAYRGITHSEREREQSPFPPRAVQEGVQPVRGAPLIPVLKRRDLSVGDRVERRREDRARGQYWTRRSSCEDANTGRSKTARREEEEEG
eukprot:1480227-Rhodomonas_salina.1